MVIPLPKIKPTPLAATWWMRGFAICTLAALAAAAGCNTGNGRHQQSNPWSPDTAQAASLAGEPLARGVIHYAIPTGDSSGIDIIDLDLTKSAAHLAVGAEGIREDGGSVVGNPLTPTMWVKRGALAAVNGGYFGDDHGSSKEVVGLLVVNGRVRHAAPALVGHGGEGLSAGHYVRSAFGLMSGGVPEITWAASEPGKPQILRSYSTATPTSLMSGRPWRPRAAIGCGPTLIHNGRSIASDRKERLVSEGQLPRTFVAYDRVDGRPRHVIVGITNAATFDELTAYIRDYFPKYDHTRVWAAMCFDGGSSTQMTYKIDGNLTAPRETEVGVTDCLLVMPTRR
jgi:hypothetical protein